MKVVGVKHMTGSFNDRAYDNYYIYCVADQTDNDTSQFYGVCPQCVKVKASLLHTVVAPDKIQKLLDREVEFLYDSYKNVALVNVISK